MRSWLACVVALAAGCYDPPRPACGFICGPQGACPTGFTCDVHDNRCHANGTTETCEHLIDAAEPDTVVDGPHVQARTPAPGATGVLVITSVTVAFDRTVTGVDESSFQLQATGSGMGVFGAVTSSGGIWALSPAEQLAGNTSYEVILTPQIVDVAGNRLPGEVWSFTTGPDTIAPRVPSMTPFSGSTGVPVSTTIEVVFDEPAVNLDGTTVTVAAGPGPASRVPVAGTVVVSNGGRAVSFVPDAPLPPATRITVTLAAGIADAAGNALGSPYVFAFTTA